MIPELGKMICTERSREDQIDDFKSLNSSIEKNYGSRLGSGERPVWVVYAINKIIIPVWNMQLHLLITRSLGCRSSDHLISEARYRISPGLFIGAVLSKR